MARPASPPVNGVAVRTFRTKLHPDMSAAEFARVCGISPPHLSEFEAGRRNVTPAVAERMAHTLGVPLGAISCSAREAVAA